MSDESPIFNDDKVQTTGIGPDGSENDIPVSGKDSLNSTDTPLGSGATFTGSWVDCEKYAGIAVTITTDQLSAINGVKIEFSDDQAGTKILRTLSTTVPPVSDGIFFFVPKEGSYYRIVYENGATAQTVFCLSAILQTTSSGNVNAPLTATLDDLSSALLTRSVIAGYNSTTLGYENVGVRDGRIQVEAVNVAATISERFQKYARNAGSFAMAVDGSTTNVTFEVSADATDDLVVDFLNFQAFDSGIKIDKFLGENNELTNGILIEIKSEDQVFQFQPIKNTTEFNSLFALGPGRGFQLIFASGADSMVATFGPGSPFVIKKQGTYGTDDYIRVIIRDDLTGVNRLRFTASGRVGA